MKNPVLMANVLLSVVGFCGVGWCVFGGGPKFAPFLVYFSILSTVGLVSALALAGKDSRLWAVASAVNKCSLLVLTGLLLSAFVISPGSGVAALVFLGPAAAINIISLNSPRGSSEQAV